MGEPAPRLTDPAQLEAIEPKEIVRRVRPLLWCARLPADVVARQEANVPGVLAELARDWESDASIDGRPVEFGEYVAVKLAMRLWRLDEQEHPELYDRNRHYLPGNDPTLLGDDGENVASPDQAELDASPERLVADMARGGIPVPSQVAVLRYVLANACGSVTTGRNSALALGRPTNRAATGPMLRAGKLVAQAEDAGLPASRYAAALRAALSTFKL